MAAISHAYTIWRAAQMLGHDEELLSDLSDQLGPEDGMFRILDVDDGEILAFASGGIEAPQEIIVDQIDRADWVPPPQQTNVPAVLTIWSRSIRSAHT